MSKLIELSDLPQAAQGPVLFWQRAIENPLQVCSLFPSSPFVGRAMTEVLGKRIESHVIELGAGTGAVTRQLIRNGVEPGKLTLVEIDARLGGHLRRRFPDTDVLIGSAEDLAKVWQERNGENVGAIISTLPMRLFSKKLIYLVMKNSLQVLDEGGMFVQFTYRQTSPVPPRVVNALRLKAWRYTRVWLNLPPAAIWVYERMPQPREI
ncbi:ribosomal RNA adenine methylase transferase [Rhodomicrobium vannielii ATCC 17100]|jgi:phosphatidylethanolamine/phosphatidyl-N-methylethanolamine N-methyltransferase|uniref:Ribosomal RNA adenine methylase transferase n=1 Tax=Rhodomicrobium vannielii (strain ATCC 17100 / DSM 162 / LMG 4299 / NCIMB 10020 / ATH 3.1.1) TaxID=648757 RepID=E3I2K5_RHOVT|nr:methyltransferase domain-containing protein [Rhodomicrobium vannielii]ADP71364.1 ribosomal RNA adenine methylase transferase [Rhodomicrobium vannielii ATCC 17100]MBJ7534277.1 methyltransferase domain-containing protein [Rhodomicrobium vannielii ATCC 17100]